MKGRIYILLLASLILSSCQDWWGRDKKKSFDGVMIMYSAGCNNLSGNLAEDIRELKNGYVPEKSGKKALLLVSHKYVKGQQTTPHLIRLYTENKKVVADTLMTYPAGTFLTKASDMNKVLTYIKDNFKSEHYGLVFSSHASGWVPNGYYNETLTRKGMLLASPSPGVRMQAPPMAAALPEGAVLYHEPPEVPGIPRTKSVGIEVDDLDGSTVSYEMTLNEFAGNIPMHMDYILFDACLMGGVEVAYALKDICRYVAFSPTEVLVDGFVYDTLAAHLLERKEPDVRSVCVDYFQQYDGQAHLNRSATVSMVDCSKLEALASLCRGYVDKYRGALADMDPAPVQRYYTGPYVHWFFDMEDIFVKAGITESERNALDRALEDAVPYKAATPTFMMWSPDDSRSSGFQIVNYSGLSMYLPCYGDSVLDNHYKTLAWNKAVNLVQ